jgi:hypothetical protein
MDSRGAKPELVERLFPMLLAEAEDLALETAPFTGCSDVEACGGPPTASAAAESGVGKGGPASEGGGPAAAEGLGRAEDAGGEAAPLLVELQSLSKVSRHVMPPVTCRSASLPHSQHTEPPSPVSQTKVGGAPGEAAETLVEL